MWIMIERRKRMNFAFQYYEGIPIQLVNRTYKGKKQKDM